MLKTQLLKLQKMSADEMLFRLKEKGYQEYERRRFSRRRGPGKDALLNSLHMNIAGNGLDSSSLLHYLRTRESVRFYFDNENKDSLIAALEKIAPGTIESSIRKADLVCSHTFSFLGIKAAYESEIPWNKDPVTLHPWPMVFYADLDHHHHPPSGVDIKYVWELNRHQFFVDLGKAYWLTGDEKYAQEFFALISDWIDANPYKIGVNWTSSLELAVRSISWLWAYHFCKHSPHLTAELNLKILASLQQHAEYISRHLSIYSSPYNHLIGELAGLFMIGILFPEFRNASRWVGKSWRLLQQELPRQFHEDGGAIEQAHFYHHFTLGFYLLVFLLAEKNGLDVNSKCWSRIESALEFSMYMTKPDGTVPMIGDVDSARSIYIENPPPWDFRAFLSTGAVLFNRGDMKFVSGGFKEDSLWLLGQAGLEQYQLLQAHEPDRSSYALPESGYYFMRSGWGRQDHYLCFDCGEQAAGLFADATPSAVHGHADALSIELAAHGRSFLVDPGLYTYFGDRQWRDYFRKTMAHNTVVVNGRDQALHLGGMNWARVTPPQPKAWISNDKFDYVKGLHRGYHTGKSAVHHVRTVLYKKHEYWIINDVVTGEGEHQIETYWHFAPGELSIDEDLKAVLTCFDDHNNLLLQPTRMDGLTMEQIEGGDKPSEGWIAPGYGTRLRAPVIEYSENAELPCTRATILFPITESDHRFELVRPPGSEAKRIDHFELRFATHCDGYVLNPFRLSNIKVEKLQTDAEILYYRKNSLGEYGEVTILNGTFVRLNDAYILQFDHVVDSATATVY